MSGGPVERRRGDQGARARVLARALLRELDDAMKSPRGDYYQGDIADPHRALHIVERHVAAALQEPRGQQAGIWPSVCEGCFYSAWVPVETEQECAFVHPHQGEHVRCDYCWLKDQLAGSPAPAAAPREGGDAPSSRARSAPAMRPPSDTARNTESDAAPSSSASGGGAADRPATTPGALVTCPWCGLDLASANAYSQIGHLVACGDSRRADAGVSDEALAEILHDHHERIRAEEEDGPDRAVWVPWTAQTSRREKRIYLALAKAVRAALAGGQP